MFSRRVLALPISRVSPSSRTIRARLIPLSTGRRWTSGESGENSSGHISVGPNEDIFYFNNLPQSFLASHVISSPILNSFSNIEDRFIARNTDAASPDVILREATKDGALGGVDVVKVVPRWAEGGSFVKFCHAPTTEPKTVENAIREYLSKHPIRPWWNPFHRVSSQLVVGKPWIEDLAKRPSRRVRVEFLSTEPGGEFAELSQEQLYSLFRPYGKLAEISKQPTDSKVLPRYSYVDFWRCRHAVMAKNCLHGYKVPQSEGGGKLGTVLRITYEKKERFGWIRDWIYNHPRIAIPLLAAFLAALSIIIFDPLRQLFIRAHITRTFHIEDNIIVRWFMRRSEDLMKSIASLRRTGGNPEAGMQVVWDDRRAEIEQLQAWLMESADTFIVVTGPRGSGKKELVIDHALQRKREAHRVLVVDCKPIQEARGDAATIAAAASQVGYKPVFSWVNNISGLIDLAAQGMTGVKAGFSETLDAQLSKICNCTSAALKSIALEGRRKDDKDANLSDDEFLEAHPELRPVLVIDNYLHKNEGSSQIVYEKVAQWAAELTTSNVAHVIFLTNDISFAKPLGKALPDRVFHHIALGDCSPQVAKQYVINHLDFDADPGKTVKSNTSEDVEEVKLTPSQRRKDMSELDDVIGLLGGRLTDLEFLARRIKAGDTPTKAVKEMIDQSASEVLKMFLLTDEERGWSGRQAWMLVKELATNSSLRYNEIIMSAPFKTGGEKAIAALEQSELISIQSLNGRPYSIKPGKPIYQPAFKQIVQDRVLAARMNLVELSEATADENKSIEKCEQELRLLAELPKQPGEIYGRIQWLLSKIAGSQAKVEHLEQQTAELKKILTNEY